MTRQAPRRLQRVVNATGAFGAGLMMSFFQGVISDHFQRYIFFCGGTLVLFAIGFHSWRAMATTWRKHLSRMDRSVVLTVGAAGAVLLALAGAASSDLWRNAVTRLVQSARFASVDSSALSIGNLDLYRDEAVTDGNILVRIPVRNVAQPARTLQGTASSIDVFVNGKLQPSAPKQPLKFALKTDELRYVQHNPAVPKEAFITEPAVLTVKFAIDYGLYGQPHEWRTTELRSCKVNKNFRGICTIVSSETRPLP